MPTVHVFARDHINTDEIIPARHLTTDVESELAKYAMEDYDRDFVRRVRPGDIIVAGADFGCGSSREHAVWALRGAGVSAESGIDTFRDGGGLWEQHRVEDVATPEAFARDPNLVLRFYDMRRENIQKAEPNAAHRALACLDSAWPGELTIVTQNVDDLHERAGAKRLIHMHGEHLSAWCTTCDSRMRWTGTLQDRPACPVCGTHSLRPDIVWFGEMPYRMGEIDAALRDCDLFVSIGTSGAVYPAAGYVQTARYVARGRWN